jgi:hypothetical protein
MGAHGISPAIAEKRSGRLANADQRRVDCH